MNMRTSLGSCSNPSISPFLLMDLFTVPPPSLSSLHKPTLFISLSLSLLLFCLALIYFNFEPLLLWLSLSLLIGPFAPPSLTAGDIRVGVGPQLEEIPAAQIEFTEKPSRKSVKSTRKASEETEGNSNAIDLSRFDLPKRRSSRSSIEAVVEAKPEEWGEADDEMLKKLMGKHPVGKPGRWEAISEGFKGRYKVETVIAKAKHIGEKKGGDQNSYTKEVDEPLDVPNVTCDGYDGSDGSDNCDGSDGSDNCDGADNVDGADGSDCDGSDGSQPSDLDYSAESCEDSTDDETLDMMVENYVQPFVRGEQPVPNYVPEGLPFFRSLPCEGSRVCRDPFGPKRRGRDLGQRYPCNWEVKATFKKRDGSWSINSWVDRHCCMGDHDPSEHVNLTSSMIALCIRSQIENDVGFKPSVVRTYIQDNFHVKISYKKAWYSRRKAIELVYGGWEGSFRQLPSYLTELQTQNPGTIVEWLHDPVLSQGNTKAFRYVFWAFGPAIEAFQVAKPVLSVDGTHLRGRLKGKLLAAVGYDANKNCLHVAFAIVDEETNESWSWFLNLVRVHIIKNDQEVCIISDRHQCIINAMKADMWKEAPVGYHRFCLIHVRSNVLQRHKGPGVKKWVWIMGEVIEERRYWTARRELEKVSPEALRYLETTIDRSQWTMAHDEFRRWGETSTNMAECYNNVLLAARELPIRAIIDITFWRTINWFVNRTTLAKQC
ncbi:hypothetical protein SASPL_126934 [Salvia splendens]|uniref:MULE transposase domain-containing protein n=1 Tax=Salvia splendens TaxID=180675 RepID=A0A8X8XHV4_SALSN|nr:hypothetical protein SASPL_126934 [Salvia splendens]